jgi:hypothetical protein
VYRNDAERMGIFIINNVLIKRIEEGVYVARLHFGSRAEKLPLRYYSAKHVDQAASCEIVL